VDGGTTKSVSNLKHDIYPQPGPRITFWGESDYSIALDRLAEELGMDTTACAWKYGFVDLPERGCEQGWYYDSAFGFSRFH
jgi:CRISPR-associated endonuclease/helicase Cas3